MKCCQIGESGYTGVTFSTLISDFREHLRLRFPMRTPIG